MGKETKRPTLSPGRDGGLVHEAEICQMPDSHRMMVAAPKALADQCMKDREDGTGVLDRSTGWRDHPRAMADKSADMQVRQRA